MMCFRSKIRGPPIKVDYDVVIIGGGISGLYTAYKLCERDPNLKIGLFEKDNKLGGRIVTKKYENFLIEYGPLRFETGIQSKLMELLFQLEVAVEPVDGMSMSRSERMPDMSLLTDDERDIFKTDNNKHGYSYPTKLIMYGMKKVLRNQWDFECTSVHDIDIEVKKNVLKKYGHFEHKPLYHYGILDVFKKVLSEEALNYVLTEGYFYYMIDKNPNAAEHICFLIDLLESLRWEFVSVKDGVHTVVERIAECVKESATVTCGMKITKVKETQHDTYEAIFADGHIVTCRHIVMTMPPEALSRVDGISHITAPILKKQLTPVQLFKIFVVVENPPWNDEGTTDVVSQFPCREVIYQMDKNSNEGMIMFYGDERYRKYWFSADNTNGNYLEEKIHDLLTNMYPDSRDWKIKVVELNDWMHVNKEQLGVHLWKSGTNCQEIIERVAAFSLSPQRKHKGIHICGEVFSEYQCFIEGALRSAEKVVDHIVRCERKSSTMLVAE